VGRRLYIRTTNLKIKKLARAKKHDKPEEVGELRRTSPIPRGSLA
jgi:hypothetical protein